MSGRHESVYVPESLARALVDAAALRAFDEEFEGVRRSAFPRYWAIDIGSVTDQELEAALSDIEQHLGARPLTAEQMDAIFDPVTGEPLAA